MATDDPWRDRDRAVKLARRVVRDFDRMPWLATYMAAMEPELMARLRAFVEGLNDDED